MAILSEYSLWFALLALLIGAAYSFFLYYKNRSVDFEKRSLITMSVLRGVVIAMIAFLLLTPMIRFSIKQTEKPVILFSIDNSESVVAFPDTVFDKESYKKALEKMVKSFDNHYNVEVMLTGEQERLIEEDKLIESLDFIDKSTNLSSIFDRISSLYRYQNVGALVMLTDGIYNTGNNPLYKAEKVNYPVYTVGLGNTYLQKDLYIGGVQHNKQAYKGNYFPVEINIAANKLIGKSATVRVFEKDNEVYSKSLTFHSNQYFETLKFSLEAKEKGIHQYRIEVDHLENEISYKNNTSLFFVEVVDSKEKIAIVYNSPHPDVSAVRQALELIDKYEVDVYPVQDFNTPPENYSLIILHQVPSLANNSSLPEKIMQSGVSVLFILGEQTSLPRFNALNTGLNIVQNKNLYNNVTPIYNNNFVSFTFSEDAVRLLNSFPPLKSFFGTYKTAVSTSVFMHQKINNISTDYPLIVFNDVNGTKTGVIAGTGLWQWRMYNHLYKQNHDAFNEIINKTVQLLSVKSDKSAFRVQLPQVFDETSDIEATAEVYNDSYELINVPEVTLVLTDNEGRKFDFRFSKQAHSYSLNMGKLPVGNYSWQASLTYGGRNHVKNGVFTVREVMLETLSLEANHDLLKSISEATNGVFFTVDEIQNVYKEIKDNPNIKPIASFHKKYSMLLNAWWYLAIIVLLFGVEWFMRKWGGGY